MKQTLLNLACGIDYRTDFINIDNGSQYPDAKIDKKADILKLKWKDNSVDVILVLHYLMYCTPPEVDMLLKRWYGWLKKGGLIEVETGNVYSVCKSILKARNLQELHGPDCIGQLFGWDNTHGHKWAWSPVALKDAFQRAGFTDIKMAKGFFHGNPERDFLISAKK